MAANVTELPRAGRHAAGTNWEDSQVASLRADKVQRRLLVAASALSLAWLALCAWYISTYLGWDLPSQLLPHEFGALVAGMATPLIVLWLVVVFARRGLEVRQHTQMLRRQLEMLTYPAEDAEARINEVSDTLRRQADELSRVSDRAEVQLRELAETLAQQTENLTSVTDRASSEGGAMRAALSQQATSLGILADRFEAQQKTVRDLVEQQIRDLSAATSRAREQAEDVGDALRDQTELDPADESGDVLR